MQPARWPVRFGDIQRSTNVRYLGDERTSRRVRVLNRDDIGEIVFDGVNIGNAFCVAVHFPNTGEVLYYLKDRVTTIEAGSSEPSDRA